MDTTWLVPLTLVFGVALGAGVTALLVAAARRGRHVADVTSQGVPEGVDEVIGAMESAALVVDPSNNVLSASASALAFGLVSNRVLTSPELVGIVDKVRRSGDSVSVELQIARGPFGTSNLYLLVRAARLGARYVIIIADDRTESHRLDEVRRDFVQNISHELKTPIGAVSLLAEALAEAAGDADQVKKFAKRLTKESDRLTRLTQEIIDLSRLQADDALHKPKLVRVDTVLVAAIDQIQVAADRANVQITSRGIKGVEVYGDEALLTVAVHNLIANAVQYSDEGSRVGIGVDVVDDIVEIAVSDQGIGIPLAERDRVFERFYRSDPARSRRTGGSGLGLSIVKHVTQNHGGDVSLWSKEGSGSTFTIRLPLATRETVKRKEAELAKEAKETERALAAAEAEATAAALQLADENPIVVKKTSTKKKKPNKKAKAPA
jgi:two-component system, OmpR family, sensor histidine kinase SenX3